MPTVDTRAAAGIDPLALTATVAFVGLGPGRPLNEPLLFCPAFQMHYVITLPRSLR